MPLPLFQQEPSFSRIKRVIAIAAGKGGVGKSTLTALLAIALKKQGQQVGIFDADLYGPSIRQLLPEDQLPVLSDEQLFPAVCKGIKVLSMAFFKKDAAMRAPIANALLGNLFQKAAWGEIDWLLIDFPPGTGDIPLTVAQRISLRGALMVTTPQKVAALDVCQAIELFRKVDVPILGIVENMSYYGHADCKLFGDEGSDWLVRETRVPVIARLPLDPAISIEGDRGNLYAIECMPVVELAKRLIQQVEEETTVLEELSLVNPSTLRVAVTGKEPIEIKAPLLQRSCPCAHCQGKGVAQEDVQIRSVAPAGRYGLCVDFSSGCSSGIYSFHYLERIKEC